MSCGETDANRQGIIQGQMDTPLSQVGVRQATLASRRLENEYFTHAYTSDLKRAAATAHIIMENNKKNKCEIISDKRLRERCFGVAQGRPCKELAAAAKKANKSIMEYIPEGAESTLELRERAKSFFRDLCKFVIELSSKEEADYTPASIKQQNIFKDFDDGNNINFSENSEVNSHKNDNTVATNSMKTSPPIETNGVNLTDAEPTDNSSKRRKCDNNIEMVQTNEETKVCFNLNSDVDTPNIEKVIDAPNVETVPEITNKFTPLRSHSSTSSGYYSLSEMCDESDHTNTDELAESIPAVEALLCENEGTDSENDTENFVQDTPGGLNVEVASYMTTGMGIKCPNVSVNPCLSRRITRCSSISSGRNNSFDDLESLPVVADILVASHGGLMKEFVRHFVDDFHCRIPGGKTQSLCVSPNTGISKYVITVNDSDQISMITCLLFHDREHLKGDGK